MAKNPPLQLTRKALDGEVNAMVSLAKFYENEEHDADYALRWYRKASEAGGPKEIYLLLEFLEKFPSPDVSETGKAYSAMLDKKFFPGIIRYSQAILNNELEEIESDIPLEDLLKEASRNGFTIAIEILIAYLSSRRKNLEAYFTLEELFDFVMQSPSEHLTDWIETSFETTHDAKRHYFLGKIASLRGDANKVMREYLAYLESLEQGQVDWGSENQNSLRQDEVCKELGSLWEARGIDDKEVAIAEKVLMRCGFDRLRIKAKRFEVYSVIFPKAIKSLIKKYINGEIKVSENGLEILGCCLIKEYDHQIEQILLELNPTFFDEFEKCGSQETGYFFKYIYPEIPWEEIVSTWAIRYAYVDGARWAYRVCVRGVIEQMKKTQHKSTQKTSGNVFCLRADVNVATDPFNMPKTILNKLAGKKTESPTLVLFNFFAEELVGKKVKIKGVQLPMNRILNSLFCDEVSEDV